jgi:hypothetical protein
MNRFSVIGLALLAGPALSFAQTPAAKLIVDWQNGSALNTPRDHHATFLVERPGANYLYVAGGTNYVDFYDTIERVRINADGSLASWEVAGKLPTPRGGTSIAVVGDYAVLTGGQVGGTEGMKTLTRIAEVYTAPISKDGSLGAWQATSPMPEARFHHPAVAHNGWIYVVGGQAEKEASAGVFAARVTPDGKIESWQQMKPLPRPRSHHAAFVHDNHIYVVGGMDGPVGGMQAVFLDVIRAQIQPDGSLSAWQIVSRIPHSYATHASHYHGGHLWLIGGVEDNARFVNTVLRAELRADGRVGAWTEVEPGLPLARGHVHNTPVLNGRMYSAGGRVIPTQPNKPTEVTGAVHIGTFRPDQ